MPQSQPKWARFDGGEARTVWALQKESALLDNRAPFSHLAVYLIAPLQGLSTLSAQRMLL